MNLAVNAPAWLLAALFVLLIAAAAEDGWRLRISNLFPLAIIAGAGIAVVLQGPAMLLWENFVIFAAMLFVGTLLFGANLLGGGDVKLLAACGLWFGLDGGWRMLVATAIAGGLLAVILLSIRPMFRDPSWAVLKRRGGIPYGIAVAAGTTAAIAWLR